LDEIGHESVPSKKQAQEQSNPKNLLDSAQLRGLTPITSDDENEADADEFNPNKTTRTEPFRNYEDSTRQKTVENFYRENHKLQTYQSVMDCRKKFLKLEKKQMTIMEAADLLNEIIDDSDPDTEASQITHLLQTAESLRVKYPGDEYDWLHLTGFIHDLGKVLSHPTMHNLEQIFCVGDTNPVGCAFSKDIVFYDFFKENEDFNNPKYNTQYGIYSPNCGLDNVTMTFGHDEYMYHVCVQNKSTLPEEALYIIRYHSFYAWHDKNAYDYLCNDKDRKNLEWVIKFQMHDLYSKLPEKPNPAKCLPYYQKLVEKYFPEKLLKW